MLRGSEQRGFPNAAFVTFTVAQNDVNAIARALQLRRERQTGTDRKTMAQRASCGFNPRNAARTGVFGQSSAVPGVFLQHSFREETAFREHRILGRAAVPLAQDKAVAIPIIGGVRIQAKHRPVQRYEQIRTRERGSGMRCLSGVRHTQDVRANAASAERKRRCIQNQGITIAKSFSAGFLAAAASS